MKIEMKYQWNIGGEIMWNENVKEAVENVTKKINNEMARKWKSEEENINNQ
jgi:hypothetical protein